MASNLHQLSLWRGFAHGALLSTSSSSASSSSSSVLLGTTTTSSSSNGAKLLLGLTTSMFFSPPKNEANCFSNLIENANDAYAIRDENKTYKIAHRTFRNEFSLVSNCLRVVRNVAVPTSQCALEFQKQLEKFDANYETWREAHFNGEDDEDEYASYREATAEAEGDLEKTREILLTRFNVDISGEVLREMDAKRPRFPEFPWKSWKRLVLRGCIRDASISSCRVMISKYLETRTTARLAMKLTKEAKMSGKRKMGRFYERMKRGGEMVASSSSSSSSYYYSSKAALTKKFAKTHALANFCNFSACWVWDMFEDLLRCYNFYKHGGYIGHPVPESEANLASCAKLYANCALKHTVAALSSAFGSATVAAITFYAFPTCHEGKGVYYALFFSQLAGDQLGLKISQFVNGSLRLRGLPRLADATR